MHIPLSKGELECHPPRQIKICLLQTLMQIVTQTYYIFFIF